MEQNIEHIFLELDFVAVYDRCIESRAILRMSPVIDFLSR